VAEKTEPLWSNPQAYEAYMGRWSRPVAHVFLTWLAAPPNQAWVDVGCGTGALTEAILETAQPQSVIGVDPSSEFLDLARTQAPDSRVSFVTGGAEAIPLPSDSADLVVSGLALNLVSDYRAGLREKIRVARSGGTVAAYVWDFAGQMQPVRAFWDAAVALDPAASDHDHATRFPICQPEPLLDLFQEACLQRVNVAALKIPLSFRDFDEYWRPHLLPGSSHAQRYMATLNPSQHEALRSRLEAALPLAPDGSLRLTARAWAVQGLKA
jgi:SAM-dependent methyltransferase